MAGPDSIVPTARPLRIALEAVALALLWAALFLPGLARPEYQNEEGRRVIPAREMAASGNYVLPTVFGRAYVAKPPAFYWSIDLVATVRGRLDEMSARLPSALATLLAAWGVLLLGARTLSWPAARAGALLFLFTPLVLEKGTLAEIEPLLGASVFGASALVWLGGRESRSATAAAALLLGIAVLAKGPAAWVFFVAMVLAAAWTEREWAGRLLLAGAMALVASTALASVWLALLLRQLGWTRLSETWGVEVTGGTQGPSYLAERLDFAPRSLGAFGVGTGLLILALLHRRARAWLEPAVLRIALWTSVLGFLFFLFFPRSQPRYLYPLAPWIALIAGQVLVKAAEPAAPRLARGLVRGGVIAIGVVGVLVPCAALARRMGLLELKYEVGAGILVLALLLGLLAAASLGLQRRSLGRALALTAGVIVLSRTIQLLVAGPRPEATHARRECAARIDRAVAPGVVIHASLWTEFNLMAHVAHRLAWVDDPLTLAPGEVAVYVEQGDPSPPSANWRVLERVPGDARRTVVVAERLAPAVGAR